MSTGIGAVGHCTGKEVVTCGSQEVPLQDRPEALGVCAEVAADQRLRGALGVVEGPALGTDARPSVPGDIGHGKQSCSQESIIKERGILRGSRKARLGTNCAGGRCPFRSVKLRFHLKTKEKQDLLPQSLPGFAGGARIKASCHDNPTPAPQHGYQTPLSRR